MGYDFTIVFLAYICLHFGNVNMLNYLLTAPVCSAMNIQITVILFQQVYSGRTSEIIISSESVTLNTEICVSCLCVQI